MVLSAKTHVPVLEVHVKNQGTVLQESEFQVNNYMWINDM